MDLNQKFSQNFKRSLQLALQLAVDLGAPVVEPIHLLYGLATQPGSLSSELFADTHVDADDLLEAIAKETSAGESPLPIRPTDLVLSQDSQRVIQRSIHIAHANHHSYVGTEHLLSALLDIKPPTVQKVLSALKLPPEVLIEQTSALLRSTSKLPDLTGAFQAGGDRLNDAGSPLAAFAIELTRQNDQDDSDPVIGRDTEIERMIQILSRRQKNNPLLIGEPGVGKTAIVEGLAQRITRGQVPGSLADKRIYALDLTSVVAGTMYRGEFEQRIKQLIDEIKKRPEVILFIDEIHNIVGTGSASGSLDAANILKPALARGQIRCIGTTTFADYRRTIEHDPALERRLQVIRINEPAANEARAMLDGLKEHYETFHQVQIEPSALDAAVTMSQRYIPERFLPDKAIDLIDEAAARANIQRRPTTQEDQTAQLKVELKSAATAKRQAIEREDYVAALEYKRICSEIEAKIKTATNQPDSRTAKAKVTDRDVALIVAASTGIPLEDITATDQRRILKLQKELASHIVGQNEAINTIISTIKLAKAGLRPADKPLAAFLFAGPSGVGKTHTAKMLARQLFGSDQALIRIDMSEYGERFNVSKLIGSPAGYVGYRESGHLTEKIKHRPYSLVLFDEVEKADPAVFDLLLQVLDDGYLTDAAGARINFRNTVIVMTSNLGSHLFASDQKIGFGNKKNKPIDIEPKMLEEVKAHFKPEFINRLDHIVYFHPLTAPQVATIARQKIAAISDRLLAQQIKLAVDDQVIDHLTKASLDKDQGIRGLDRLISHQIESLLADLIIRGKIKNKNTIRVSVKNGIIEVK